MKKYLITGAMALLAGFYLTSCTHDDIEYSSLYEEKTQSYDKVFKELYGTIDPNHDWGFKSLGSAYSGTRALTRGEDINGNIWYQNWERPVNVTDQEMDPDGKVVRYFKEVRGENEITITWDNYWVQQVYQSNNEYTAADNLNTYIASQKMNHLMCYDHNAAGGYHSYNFNAGNNTTTFVDEGNGYEYIGTTLMKDMGSYSGTNAQFGYHNSVDSKNHFEYFIVAGETIDPNDPLLAGHYYVGFDFSCTGSNPNMQVERDHKYDDWIVRISPATRKTSTGPQGGGGETTTSKKYKADQHKILARGRVFVEDLFKASREDIDFNDAVFDAIIWEVTRGTVTVEEDGTKTFVRDETIAAKDSVEISLLAAGGTIPLKIADGKFGEVHEAFHKSGVTMVNTRGNYSEAYGSYENGVTPVYKKFDYTDELANKNPKDITLNDIRVAAFWKSNDYTAAAILNNGETQFDEDGNIIKQTDAPHMLCALIGTRWATERKNIMEGYPAFRSYVNDKSYGENVWESATPESSFNLYEDNPSPLKYGSEDEGFVYYDNIEEIFEVEGTPLRNESTTSGQFEVTFNQSASLLNNAAETSKIRIYVTSPSTGYWHVNLCNKAWQNYSIPDWNNSSTKSYNNQPADFPGYVEFSLTSTLKSAFITDNGFIIQTTGGISVDCITFIP
jgi:hypothetical protein